MKLSVIQLEIFLWEDFAVKLRVLSNTLSALKCLIIVIDHTMRLLSYLKSLRQRKARPKWQQILQKHTLFTQKLSLNFLSSFALDVAKSKGSPLLLLNL